MNTVPLHCSLNKSDKVTVTYHFPMIFFMILPWIHQLMFLHGLFYMHLFHSSHTIQLLYNLEKVQKPSSFSKTQSELRYKKETVQ